jgi:hypothetical protein
MSRCRNGSTLTADIREQHTSPDTNRNGTGAARTGVHNLNIDYARFLELIDRTVGNNAVSILSENPVANQIMQQND